MARKACIMLVVAGLGLCTCAALLAYPRPSPSPRGWQLDFDYGAMQMVRLGRAGEPVRTYWFLPYTVTNNTGRDIDFYPHCQLLTDTGQLVNANQRVDALAYPDISKLIGRELLEEELCVKGRLLQGEENARESVIIIRDFDPRAKSFKLFISGLSEEVVWETDPMTGKKYPLVKTMQLSYAMNQDRHITSELAAELRDQEWVMR